MPAGPIWLSERATPADGGYSESLPVEMVPSSWLLGDEKEEPLVYEEKIVEVPRGRGSWASRARICRAVRQGSITVSPIQKLL